MVEPDTRLDYPPPAGCVWAWVPDEGWRIEQPGKLCRRMGTGHEICKRPAVASMNRGHFRRSTGRRDAWWPYCEGHLYGRRIENGVVLRRVAVSKVPTEEGA